MPDDLEWPRRAIVGAIAVIGVAGLTTFAKRPAWSSAPSREILCQDRGELLECPVDLVAGDHKRRGATGPYQPCRGQ